MLHSTATLRISPIIISYGDIGREKKLPPDVTSRMTEKDLHEFERVFKIGIVKQLERKGLLTTEQSVQLVDMQKRRGL